MLFRINEYGSRLPLVSTRTSIPVTTVQHLLDSVTSHRRMGTLTRSRILTSTNRLLYVRRGSLIVGQGQSKVSLTVNTFILVVSICLFAIFYYLFALYFYMVIQSPSIVFMFVLVLCIVF